MVKNAFRQALREGRFIYSVELTLGKNASVPEFEHFIEEAGTDGGVCVISVTDLPGGRPALPPEAVMNAILDRGLTPIAHLTGKDGNRNFIESRLHGLARLGVENLLALTGDAPANGYEGRAKPVYDLDSTLILQLIETLVGRYAERATEAGRTPYDFFPGAVVNPYKVREPDQMMQYFKLELKIAVGARFIMTQLGYNIRKLYELKQYMNREGLGAIPVIPGVYVLTEKIAQMMRAGAIPGCVIPDALLDRVAHERKAQRLERAALMMAAVKALGFAGAHIGGFRISYRDVLTLIERAEAIGKTWIDRLDELLFEYPDTFYLLSQGADGLSAENGPYQVGQTRYTLPWAQRICLAANRQLIAENSPGAAFLRTALGLGQKPSERETWRRGFWYHLLDLSGPFKRHELGCVGCGDCIQDHLVYAGCTMGRCYKELRNGPCGGSRPDGTCEVNPDQPCVWTLAYQNTLAAMQDPGKFAHTLIPPRDWSLNRTNSMANRIAGIDNYHRRKTLTGCPGDYSTPPHTFEENTNGTYRGVDQLYPQGGSARRDKEGHGDDSSAGDTADGSGRDVS